MSVNYIDKSTGDLIRVAGQGKAEYGASTVRKGTVTFTIDPQAYATVSVTFATPMPDADYLVDVSFPAQQPISYYVVNNRTKNGFNLFIKNDGGDSASASVTYTAFKLYTDTEYNNLLNNAVLTSDVTNVIENGNMNPVTSNAVRALFSAYEGYTDITPMESGGSLTVQANSAGTWIKTNIDFTNPHDIFIPRFFGNGIIIINWSVRDGKLIFLPFNVLGIPVTLERVWFNTIKVVAE